MKYGGYAGKILRVDLTKGGTREEPLDEDAALKLLGGRGLAASILFRELKPKIDPLGPENKLIFMSGPLAGSGAPCTTRCAVVTKSPLTGIYLVTLAAGNFAGQLKAEGYDGIIVEGMAEKPVYVWLHEGKAEIRSAERYWGMMTEDTQTLLKEDLREDKIEVACVGPPGERLVQLASIISGRRAFGRGGAGAVMGSKKLKAVAVLSKQKPSIRIKNQEAYREAVSLAYKNIRENKATGQTFPKYGTPSLVLPMNEHGVLPTRNFQSGFFDKAELISGENMRTNYVVKDKACFACPIMCSKLTLARAGPYAGVLTEGPDYETIYSMGSECGNSNFDSIIAADRLCDDYGLDSISAGCAVAFAMECFERGILTTRDTDGIELHFGNHVALVELIGKMARREGFGDVLADGALKASRRIGRDSEKYVMHVKGMELPGYEPRGMKGMGLNYATACRGACHCRGYTVHSEIFRRNAPWPTEPFAYEGKGKLVNAIQDLRAVYDASIFCAFAQGAYSLDVPAKMLSAVIGVKLDEAELYRVGHRINTLERAFNVREGVTRKDDVLPERLLKEPMPEGASKGYVVELEPMLDEYYEQRGWNVETGIPTKVELKELGLADVAAELERLGLLK